jgi:hypothetical protein
MTLVEQRLKVAEVLSPFEQGVADECDSITFAQRER